jgi:DNA polymerase-3 subunit epsilon
MLGFDLETTGVDVENDRVVTATIVTLNDGKPSTREWLVNPGVEIPEAATALHGVTTEHAREHGTDPAETLHDIVCLLAMDMAHQVPMVGMNLAYDLTLLDRECRRHGVPTLGERLDAERGGQRDQTITPVIDVFVIDKAMDKYRPGKRQLHALAETYEVRLDDAHTSTGDVLGTLRVAWRMATLAQQPIEVLAARYGDRRYPMELARAWQRLGVMSLAELHDAQIGWYAEQSRSYRQYLMCQMCQGEHDKAAEVCDLWPLRPAPTT